MGLRTQAKELMGLLEAHTVVSAKAKLAGSTPTLREGGGRFEEEGSRGQPTPLHHPRNPGPPLLPSQEPGVESSPLSHRLRSSVYMKEELGTGKENH